MFPLEFVKCSHAFYSIHPWLLIGSCELRNTAQTGKFMTISMKSFLLTIFSKRGHLLHYNALKHVRSSNTS